MWNAPTGPQLDNFFYIFKNFLVIRKNDLSNINQVLEKSQHICCRTLFLAMVMVRQCWSVEHFGSDYKDFLFNSSVNILDIHGA